MSTPEQAPLPDVPVEIYGVFEVMQLTRGSALESIVAADWVTIGPEKISEIHRHNQAETVLWIVEGSGIVVVEGVDHEVTKGARIAIGKGLFHGVRTRQYALTFLSIQSPPILNKEDGHLDLERLDN